MALAAGVGFDQLPFAAASAWPGGGRVFAAWRIGGRLWQRLLALARAAASVGTALGNGFDSWRRLWPIATVSTWPGAAGVFVVWRIGGWLWQLFPAAARAAARVSGALGNGIGSWRRLGPSGAASLCEGLQSPGRGSSPCGGAPAAWSGLGERVEAPATCATPIWPWTPRLASLGTTGTTASYENCQPPGKPGSAELPWRILSPTWHFFLV